MIAALRNFPLLIVLSLVTSLSMLGPALHALWLQDLALMQIFLFWGAVWTTLSLMVGIVTSQPRQPADPVKQVFLLLVAYTWLPVILATPMAEAVPSITFQQAYFEMLSSLTTTGATVFADPAAVPDPLHLWRGMTAWAGGLMILVAAVAVLWPLQMGGFEVEHAASRTPAEERSMRSRVRETARNRLARQTALVLPPYALLTLILTFGLLALGDRALVALIHAMSIVSTSGITPLASFSEAASGRAGEALIFVFLMIVLTRRATSFSRWSLSRIGADPEMQLALAGLAGVTALLFLRHFAGAIEVQGQENFGAAMQALWGSLFSILSFMSTTGFESRDWAAMQNWSGLQTPGLILLSLTILGGGIATTTGGVKLLRVYALYKHGLREMQRMIHPNSVGGAGITARRIRRQGAQIAWVFLMLFLLALSAVLLALTAFGLGFEDALVLAIAALTTTGPAVGLLNPGLDYWSLGTGPQMVLSVAMIFGRLELLVLVSVLNPSFWRG